MTDTSPAALKAWALENADLCEKTSLRALEMFGQGAGGEALRTAALFRAVAALADLAAGGDAQREEDANAAETEADQCDAHGHHGMAQLLRNLARYAREGGGWRTMDGALRDRKGHFLAGHPEHGVTECWCVRDAEHPWGVALMTPDGPLPDRASARWRWRPLPAPPQET